MFRGVEITSNVKRDKTRQIFIFFVQLSFFPAFLPCRSLFFFPSGVDRAVLLGTGLAFQQLCSPLVPQKSCCALVPVWAGAAPAHSQAGLLRCPACPGCRGEPSDARSVVATELTHVLHCAPVPLFPWLPQKLQVCCTN